MARFQQRKTHCITVYYAAQNALQEKYSSVISYKPAGLVRLSCSELICDTELRALELDAYRRKDVLPRVEFCRSSFQSFPEISAKTLSCFSSFLYSL